MEFIRNPLQRKHRSNCSAALLPARKNSVGNSAVFQKPQDSMTGFHSLEFSTPTLRGLEPEDSRLRILREYSPSRSPRMNTARKESEANRLETVFRSTVMGWSITAEACGSQFPEKVFDAARRRVSAFRRGRLRRLYSALEIHLGD